MAVDCTERRIGLAYTLRESNIGRPRKLEIVIPNSDVIARFRQTGTTVLTIPFSQLRLSTDLALDLSKLTNRGDDFEYPELRHAWLRRPQYTTYLDVFFGGKNATPTNLCHQRFDTPTKPLALLVRDKQPRSRNDTHWISLIPLFG